MIVTLTLNPALDLTYRLDALPLGGVGRVAPPTARAGGKGINVARVLHQMGVPVHAVTTIGGATGRLLADDLDFPHTLVPVEAETRRTLVLAEPSRTTLLNETGLALTPQEASSLVAAARALPAEVLVIAGSLPPEFPLDDLARLIEGTRARTIVDTSGEALLRACALGADVVKPNRVELAATTGSDDLVAGARALLERGAGLVVVSDGERGLVAVGPDRIMRGRPSRVLAGNATGAGDAVVAALATAVPAEELATSLARAVTWSARAVAHPLAGSLADIDIAAIIEEEPC